MPSAVEDTVGHTEKCPQGVDVERPQTLQSCEVGIVLELAEQALEHDSPVWTLGGRNRSGTFECGHALLDPGHELHGRDDDHGDSDVNHSLSDTTREQDARVEWKSRAGWDPARLRASTGPSPAVGLLPDADPSEVHPIEGPRCWLAEVSIVRNIWSRGTIGP